MTRINAEPGMVFKSTKTYNHNIGLSCTFRQWRAKSHCRFMHGYALKVHLEFEARELDENNWAVDFGSLKPIKAWLEEQFDHKTLVAQDDPQISIFRELAVAGIIQLNVVPSVGVEAFAYMIYQQVLNWLVANNLHQRITCNLVSVHEHDGNGASYGRGN